MANYLSDYIINKNALINNVKKIRSVVGDGVKICAVVKADAYGVGAKDVAPIFNPYINCFAVANVMEGMRIRELKIDAPICVLGAWDESQIKSICFHKLTPSVGSISDAIKLSRGVKSGVNVQFSLNSGMNRFGFSKTSEILKAKDIILRNSKINIWGVYSHLATKENDVDFIYRQVKIFESFLACFSGDVVRNIANTSATFCHADLHYQMVRCGYALYGMSKNDWGLLPAVEIKSRVASIQSVNSGESIGYDRTYKTTRQQKIGIVPLGYYDGVSRGLSNCGHVLINGKVAPIVGRVCMDSFMVDISNIENVSVGSVVTILGKDGYRNLSVDDYASLLYTSPYEILTGFRRDRLNTLIVN